MKKWWIFLLCFLLLPSFFLLTQQKDESLKYKVDVRVLLIPIIAVSTKGEPVYDLKQNEIQLFIDGQPSIIQYFNRYQFEDRAYVEEEVRKPEKQPEKQLRKRSERVVFVILDCMFNSRTGFRRTKEITTDLIKKGAPGDQFVILQNHAIAGLKYITGSEDGIKKMMKKINKLKISLERRSQHLFSSRIQPGNVDFDLEFEARLESSKWKSVRRSHLAAEEMRYKNQLKRFKYSLSQLKYALKTIVKPKIVFLISEGIARGAFKTSLMSEWNPAGDAQEKSGNGYQFDSLLLQNEKIASEDNKVFSAYHLKYLIDVVKAINMGGGMLYTVNPMRINDTMDEERSGEMSLMFLASEGGGKYFAGSKPVEIVKRIKKTTSAYYELGVSYAKQTNRPIEIQVKSKRPGVRIHSLSFSEKKRVYAQMAPIQKKLFAFNVVTGGDWSRIVGKVVRVKYRKVKPQEKDDKTNQMVEIDMPEKMKNKEVDIFLVKYDSKTKKTDVSKITEKVADKVKIPIKKEKKTRQYFAIIEPAGVLCIYNEIK